MIIDSSFPNSKYSDRSVDERAETQFSEPVTDDPTQPDSSADGIAMAPKTGLHDESEILAPSEVVDYMVECEVISENVPSKVIFSTTTII